MCGVAAIFAYHYAALEVDPKELRTIRDQMVRRGPDGFGEWFSEDGRVGLGHRRLSIIDLSEKGAQPMLSEDGKLAISFNGEIYNYREIRQELERKGRRFRSQTDTEVLLQLYAEKGEAMFGDLRGMFAFALWDENKKAMLLARDPFGIKPLYYANDGWTMRVASQVKALLASEKVSRIKEPAGIAGFFLTGSVPEPFTTYQEIRSLPAGSFMWVDEIGPSVPKPYFSVAKTFADAVNQSAELNINFEELIHNALKESVRYHFVADVPVGLFLSSGIDSCSLLSFASDLGVNDLKTVTLVFNEFKNSQSDESPLARQVAKMYGTDHSEYELSREEFKADLPKVFQVMDQPSIDGINTYFVSKAAASKGLKVALSGLGGDELFGGYPSFRDVPLWVNCLRWSNFVPGFGYIMRLIMQQGISLGMSPKMASMAEHGGSYEGSYLLRRGLFMPWELKAFLGKEMAGEGLRRLGLFSRIRESITPNPKNSFSKVASMEMSFYMRNQLLRDADWAGMAHSLEIRVPFVDIGLFKALVPAIISWSSGNHKKLLAQSIAVPLRNEITSRGKTGFTVPIDQWLDAEKHLDGWRKIPSLDHPRCHWSRRWAYTVYNRMAA